jgi:small subunit ribosomal protein S1
MEQNDAQIGQGDLSESTLQVEDNNSTATNMETLLLEEGLALDFPQAGEIRTGVIASIGSSQILVSVGAKSEGVITGRELEQISTEDRNAFKVGQDISVYVLSPEDNNGNVVLSFTRAQEQMGWEVVEKMLGNDEVFDGLVDGFNKGGLIVPVHGLRGFVPASQISMSRRMAASGDTPEQRWAKMVNQPITVRVIEVDRSRRRLILSERATNTETRQSLKERVIDELQEGEIRTGRVTSLADFGAFVNINGADGLVHLSELSWERVQHSSEVLEVGQEVTVKIISIDREKKRIGLSLRALTEDPWAKRIEKFQVGQLVEGEITRLTKFGAFARLEGDVEGLIHISEISETRIEHPKEKLKEGEKLTLRIIRIDSDQRRIGLSLRKVDSGAYKDQDLAAFELDLGSEEIPEPEA